MKNYIKKISLLISCLVTTTLSMSQTDYECHIVVPSGSVPEAIGAGANGEVFTPKGNLKVLTIFAGFDDGPNIPPSTNFQENQPLSGWTYQPGNPTIPDALIANPDKWMYDDLNEFGNGEYNLSEFYSEMSMGSFKMYGDILKDPVTNQYVRIDVDPTQYAGGTWSGMNKLVLAKMQQLYPNFDWSPYDNRDNFPNFQFDNSATPTPDFFPDYVIIIYRYDKRWGVNGNPGTQPVSGMQNWSGSGGAVSHLNVNGGLNYNGYVFDGAGFTMPSGADVPDKKLGLFIHELAHELYSCPHQFGVNGTLGEHYFSAPSTGFGMMSNYARINFTANAWERWLLGWIDLTTETTQRNTDLQSAADLTNNGIYTLRDVVTTGDVIRIEIPRSNGQYLWLENHQSQSMFDYKPWEGKDPSPEGELIPAMSKGLYMYKEAIEGDRNNVSTGMAYDLTKVNGMELLNANGNYEYDRSPFAVVDPGRYWNNPVYDFKRKLENQTEGTNNYHNYFDNYPQNDDSGVTDNLITVSGTANGGISESRSIIRENNGGNSVMTYAHLGG